MSDDNEGYANLAGGPITALPGTSLLTMHTLTPDVIHMAASANRVAEGLAKDADGLIDSRRIQSIRDQAHGWSKFAEFLLEGRAV